MSASLGVTIQPALCTRGLHIPGLKDSTSALQKISCKLYQVLLYTQPSDILRYLLSATTIASRKGCVFTTKPHTIPRIAYFSCNMVHIESIRRYPTPIRLFKNRTRHRNYHQNRWLSARQGTELLASSFPHRRSSYVQCTTSLFGTGLSARWESCTHIVTFGAVFEELEPGLPRPCEAVTPFLRAYGAYARECIKSRHL